MEVSRMHNTTEEWERLSANRFAPREIANDLDQAACPNSPTFR